MEFNRRENEIRLQRLDELIEQSDMVVEKAFNALQNSDLGGLIKDGLPDSVTNKILDERGRIKLGDKEKKKMKKIIDKVIKKKEMKDLIDGIQNRRPQRVVIAGEQGIGKSSLINALLGEYSMEVGEGYGTETLEAEEETITENGNEILKVLDTRGLDDYAKDSETEANKQLKEDIDEFRPDVILFVLHAKREAHQKASFEVMKNIQKRAGGVPVVTILNKADELAPKERGEPVYNSEAEERFEELEGEIRERLEKNNLEVKDIITTCAYIEWDEARENISYDRLYGIDRLYSVLTKSVDFEAQVNFNMYSRIEDLLFKVAHRLSWSTAGAASVIGGSHFIPFSDMYILLPLEVMLVMIIAYISGRPMEPSSAVELINAVGITGGIAYLSKLTFQQLAKFVPGHGTAAAASVAGAGVYAIGMVAAYYFIRDKEVDLYSLYDRFFELFEGKARESETPDDVSMPDVSDLPGS